MDSTWYTLLPPPCLRGMVCGMSLATRKRRSTRVVPRKDRKVCERRNREFPGPGTNIAAIRWLEF